MIKRIFLTFFIFCQISYCSGPYELQWAKSGNPHPPNPTMEKYIIGYNFRSIADFIFDEHESTFDANSVKPGSIIFVSNNVLKDFFQQKHRNIKNQYILVSHNGDLPAPGPFTNYLEDKKILHWFALNGSISNHAKFTHIPVGFINDGRFKSLYDDVLKLPKQEKKILLYLNFNLNTNAERKKILELFINKPWAYDIKNRKNLVDYLSDLAKSYFVLSPHGMGLDCYRTWEAIFMGSIPIVKTSTLDSLYKDLPVLIVKDWNEITEKFLKEKHKEFSKKKYKIEKIYMEYWIKKIKDVRDLFFISKSI